MERVIVVSKFKAFLNRLFAEPDNPNDSHVKDGHESNDSEQQKQLEKQPEQRKETREKPTFRFPIIADSEIYGWDESIKDREFVKQPSPTEEEVKDDDYEPIPLYENDRWPKQKSPANVFRANKGAKYQSDSEPKARDFSSKVTEVNEKLTAVPKSMRTVQKTTNKRFTPSTVPSPIHGFSSKNKHESTTIVKEGAMKLVQIEQPVIEEMIPDSKDIKVPAVPKESPVVEIEEVKEVVNPAEVLKENEPEVAATEAILEEIVPLQEDLIEDVVEVEEALKVIEETKVVELVEAIEKAEVVDEQELVHVEEIESHGKRKEKIVPFNVLMLKSDKEKLTNGQQRQSQTEMILVEEKEVVVSSSEVELVTLEEPLSNEGLITNEIVEEPVNEATIEVVEEPEEIEELAHYVLPSIDLLMPPELQIEDTDWLVIQSEKLEESLSHFGVQATVIDAVQGPSVTRFELTVGQGTKVSRVRNLTDDLKLALAAEDIRIQAPIPGRSSIGIEIPNKKTRPVRISEVIGTDEFNDSTSPLEAVLGLSLTGKPVTIDLRKMPHGMIAGATGSGKSVCINSILISLLYKASPADLKMMLIDPKMVELAPFNGIPHLISPVITDVKAATAALKWAVGEMERRYESLAHAGVRDIERYNKAAIESRQFSRKMPYLLIVIDELSDLMMMAPADVEISISRIAQKARACGIHLIIATQRPSVDVITGTIKANIPTRIAFSVSSQVDSRTIIDTVGAERLLGRGDMLYLGNGQSSTVRLQGTFVTDEEIERIIEHVQREASPNYLFGQDELLKSAVEEEETDPLFEDACLFIFEQGSASTSLLQRNFSIGYNRAAKLMDRIEKRGFISGQRGSKARDVLLTETDLEQLSETLI